MSRRTLRVVILIGLMSPAAGMAQTAYDRPQPAGDEEAKMAWLAESILGPGARTYLAPVPAPSGGALPRWRTGAAGERRTVTIHYENPDDPVRFGTGYRWAVNQAITQWTSIPGVALRFRDAAGPRTAQVTVKWVPRMSTEHSGLTSWQTDADGWIVSAVVTLTLLGGDGAEVDRSLARRIALHEVGHLIGLPHSDDAGDMMFPTSEQSRLSSRDRDAARLLYSLEPWSLLDEAGPKKPSGE